MIAATIRELIINSIELICDPLIPVQFMNRLNPILFLSKVKVSRKNYPLNISFQFQFSETSIKLYK